MFYKKERQLIEAFEAVTWYKIEDYLTEWRKLDEYNNDIVARQEILKYKEDNFDKLIFDAKEWASIAAEKDCHHYAHELYEKARLENHALMIKIVENFPTMGDIITAK